MTAAEREAEAEAERARTELAAKWAARPGAAMVSISREELGRLARDSLKAHELEYASKNAKSIALVAKLYDDRKLRKTDLEWAQSLSFEQLEHFGNIAQSYKPAMIRDAVSPDVDDVDREAPRRAGSPFAGITAEERKVADMLGVSHAEALAAKEAEREIVRHNREDER